MEVIYFLFGLFVFAFLCYLFVEYKAYNDFQNIEIGDKIVYFDEEEYVEKYGVITDIERYTDGRILFVHTNDMVFDFINYLHNDFNLIED